MQKIQNADFQTNEKIKEKENTLSKSADTFSTRELILNLNNSFIARKSKEYNFDFNKASSYDTNLSYRGFLRGNQENLFYSHFAAEEPKEVKLTGRKTSCHVNFSSEKRLENHSYVCSKGICDSNLAYKINGLLENVVSKSANLESNEGKRLFANSLSDFNDVSTFDNSDENNEYLKKDSNCNYFGNQNKEANKESGLKSQHSISNITRKTSSDAFKKLKERIQILQQQKKNFVEFFETKNQKENDCENDNPNVYFE